MNRRGISLSLLLAFATLVSAQPTSAAGRYVATTGKDSNDGSKAHPWRTIQHCATTVNSGTTCWIREGIYREAITPNSGVKISGFKKESVTIDGTDPISGWTQYSGNIYKATAHLANDDSNQVFVGTEMMTEARWPNGDDLFHPVWATAQNGTTETTLVDSKLPSGNWKGAGVHYWSGSDAWSSQTATVTASSAGQLTVTLDGASFAPYIIPQSGGYYYVFGALAALDVQREWYYDSAHSKLYFYAPGGVDPNTISVTAKTRQFAFDLSGKSNVTIEKVNLFATSIKTDGNSSGNLLNSITATYVSHYTHLYDINGDAHSYWYAHAGAYGLTPSGIVLWGQNNTLENSTISYSAGVGVSMAGSNNTTKNNLIHHVDYMGNDAAAIVVEGHNAAVTHNTIYASARTGIFPATFLGFEYPADNDNLNVSWNNIFEGMMLSRDGGEIYAGNPPCAAGWSINHNWIHDTQSLYPGPADTWALSGVYLDENSCGWEVDQNVAWNNATENLQIHGSTSGDNTANDNNMHNNSVIDINPSGYISVSQVSNCGTTQVVDNLVLVAVQQSQSNCLVQNNNATAPGATDMSGSVKVGCNFTGCVSKGPPKLVGMQVGASIAVQPYSIRVAAGQTATFSVVGEGTPNLSYQWSVDGSAIKGATSPTYSIANTKLSQSGSQITVKVKNSISSVVSDTAVLTVE
jgi:parallel beta-helix repeat protein